MTSWIDQLILNFSQYSPIAIYQQEFMVRGALALILVGVVCGSIGSLVVGNRMAFFSDALAHCAFAGVGLGLLIGIVTGTQRDTVTAWLTPIMVGFGIVMGLGIAVIRDKTSQPNDTIIGVFFALAIGMGAIFMKAGSQRQFLPPEDFLFGDLISIPTADIVALMGLVVLTSVVIYFLYNRLIFASFSPTLARSRGIPVRLLSYLFIVLLAVIVNLCLKTVGVLLINGLIIAPAATASNLAKNVRQLFLLSIILCVASGLLGQIIAWEISMRNSYDFDPGESGVIVVFAVLLYFISIPLGKWLRGQRSSPIPNKQ